MKTVASIWRKRAAQPVLGVFFGLVLVLQTAVPITAFAQAAPAPDSTEQTQEENKEGEQSRFVFNPKVDICHKEGNGSFHEIEISFFALLAHVLHGDIYPVPQNGCPSDDEETGNLTLIKEVVGGQGQGSAGLWTLYADGEGADNDFSGTTPVSSEVEVGDYTLSESGPEGYTASDWVCVIASDDDEEDDKKASVLSAPMEGNVVTVGEDQDITCTITNTFIEEVPNDLVLESICSDDPETIRAWKVTNPTDSEIEFDWFLNGDDQTGNGTAPANGSTTIITNTQGDNTLEITWYEGDSKQDASLESTGLLCPKDNQPCGTELVANGSFEVPAIESSWDIVDNNTPGLGWFVQWMPVVPGAAPIPASVEFHRGVNGWAPQEGQQHAELDGDWGGPSSGQSGEDGSTKIYQHLPTVSGNEYTISFWTSPRPGIADNQVRFSWDGIVQDTIVENGSANGQTVWTQHTYTLTATGPMTTIEFADLSAGDSLGSFIDNVSVVEDCVEDPCNLEPNDNPSIFSAVVDFIDDAIKLPYEEDCISTISGMKFNDLNGDGLKDIGEPGLEGWDIYAYNGIPSSNITVDSANINGSNTNAVDAGMYVVMARGTWNNGGTQFFDTEFHTANTWSTHEDGVVPYGEDIGDIVINDTNFVDWGVYNDQNENGFEHYYFYILNHPGGNINYSVFDGESGVKNPGWYGDNTGSINVQMYKLLDTAVTDANGDYTLEFDTDEAVTAVVREVQKNGWMQTSPNSSTGVYALNGLIEGVNYPITGNWNYIFEPGNRNVTGADFGNHYVGYEEESCDPRIIISDESRVALTQISDDYPNEYPDKECAISGYKYEDIDGDGDLDEGEEGLKYWTIYIDENDNNILDDGEVYDITDENGFYSFSNLPAGEYTIREENQAGWNTIFPSNDDETNEYVINLVLASHNGTDFFNQPEDEPCEEVSEEVSLFSSSDTNTAGYTTTVLASDSDGLDENNYSGGGFFTNAVELVSHPAWIDPTTNGSFSGSGAVWISTNVTHPGAEGGEGQGNENQWRLFQTKFTVPADAVVTPGTLYFSADNAVSVYLNGTLIDDTSEDLVTYGPNVAIPEVFKNVYSVVLSPAVGQENVLEFVVRNSAIGQVENPTGLLYNGDFSYVVDCGDDGGNDGGDGDGDGGSSSGSSSNRTGRVLGDSTGLPYEAPGKILGATTLPRTGNSVELYTLLAFMAVLMATPLLSRKAAK